MTTTRDLREAIIMVGDDDNVSVALVCLNSADLGSFDLSGFGFGVEDEVPFLESPDGNVRINLPPDSYTNAMLAMDKEEIVVRSMDLERDDDAHVDFAVHFIDRSPSSGLGAR